MRRVICTSNEHNDLFTKNKSYVAFKTSDGLTIIDDSDEEHVIATKRNDEKSYDGDTFFKNHFKWDESSEEPETQNDDPQWSIDCPECGYKHADWQNFIDTDDMSGEFEQECEACGENFDVKFKTTIEFATKSKGATEFNQNVTKKD